MNTQTRWAIGRRALACAIVGLATLGILSPAIARADGDPASDVLVSKAAFIPNDAGFSASQQAQLSELLDASNESGFTIRVAVIPSEYDLGSVFPAWHKPQAYAEFLGVELSLTYTHRLLVVMPNGFGFNWPHHSPAAAEKALGRIAIQPGGAGLLKATEAAVRGLASMEGILISAA